MNCTTTVRVRQCLPPGDASEPDEVDLLKRPATPRQRTHLALP
jgi:hypothetical protein